LDEESNEEMMETVANEKMPRTTTLTLCSDGDEELDLSWEVQEDDEQAAEERGTGDPLHRDHETSASLGAERRSVEGGRRRWRLSRCRWGERRR
jgi:hypothetical protein